ncbi:transcriptional regulator, LuxR family [Kribbella flavida DSM 17836]|uniref:Transcriptional regulator, LuxR family n=1 Tax=Kribbella flavida (strain DSM 17836 / JCM 10339 / NBRC 14399) TaxID=479435 RepID=D2PUH6_KRIFD|nr:LuxR family transcriptional regulator [Kribbella flavida]ADB29494.1 transcriptional regulator, LuxR family [Kribbella flavida DSM 17836]
MGSTLERPGELSRIAAALDAAGQGNGRVVVIEGEAGIGKTRLVGEARALAKQRGFVRMQAIGDELESALAWGVVRQMVERSIARYAGEVRAAILAGPAGRALDALDKATPNAGDAEVARTMHALWWVAVDLASPRPLLISVDDAQWSDLPSLRFLSYLSKRVADLPIALVVATRPPSDRLGPLAELTVSRHVERLLPRPLSREAIGTLTAEHLASAPHPAVGTGEAPAEKVVDAVLEASGGNPFLAESLLDELSVLHRSVTDPATADAVRGLASSAVSRTTLARLSPDALALASAVAILGARADLWAAGSIAGLADAPLSAAIDGLVAANVVTTSSAQVSFLHPVIRESVRSMLGPIEKAALHARAAETLSAAGAPAARVAAHLIHTPADSSAQTVEVLCEAAASSAAAGDTATAISYLTRALEGAPGNSSLQGQLGLTLLRGGDAPQARHHLLAAAAASAVPERAALLAAAATATSLIDGPLAAANELVHTLADWPGPPFAPDRLTLEARLGILRSYLPTERKKASEHLRRFADLPGETPDERTLLALLAQRGRYEVSPAADVRRTAERALRHGALFKDSAGHSDTLVGWLLAMMSLVAADGVTLAREEIAGARDWVRRHGSPIEFAMVANVADFVAWRCGDLPAVEADADGVLAAVEPEDLTPQVVALRATAVHFGGYAALERGDVAAAQALLADFETQCQDAPRVIAMMWLHELRARIALEQDHPAAALEHAYRLRDEMAAAELDPLAVPWRTPAAWALLRLGSEEEARQLAADQLELARRWGAASDLGTALRLTAKVDVGQGARRVATLAEAVAVLEKSPAQLELAKALVELGEALRVVGRRTEAREALARGGELAAVCGSAVIRQRAAEALQALGDRPRTLISTGQDSLTASERRVAGLAVSGRTNRDIAHELFVSPKTVENHLGRIYVKLGITGRRELARALT